MKLLTLFFLFNIFVDLLSTYYCLHEKLKIYENIELGELDSRAEIMLLSSSTITKNDDLGEKVRLAMFAVWCACSLFI